MRRWPWPAASTGRTSSGRPPPGSAGTACGRSTTGWRSPRTAWTTCAGRCGPCPRTTRPSAACSCCRWLSSSTTTREPSPSAPPSSTPGSTSPGGWPTRRCCRGPAARPGWRSGARRTPEAGSSWTRRPWPRPGEAGDLAAQAVALLALATDALELSGPSAWEEPARAAEAIAERERLPYVLWTVSWVEMSLAALRGDLVEADRRRDHVLALAREVALPVGDIPPVIVDTHPSRAGSPDRPTRRWRS